MKTFRLFLVSTLFVCWSASSTALPISYDFGFIDPAVNGFQGTGTFTVSTLVGPPDLLNFSYSGTCFFMACSFGLADVQFANWNFVDQMQPDFSFVATLITILPEMPPRDVLLTIEVGPSVIRSEARIITSLPVSVFFQRSASVGAGGAFIVETTPTNPEPVPVPATLFLFGMSMAGLAISRRIRSYKG